jgi:hypothetical protein
MVKCLSPMLELVPIQDKGVMVWSKGSIRKPYCHQRNIDQCEYDKDNHILDSGRSSLVG